jgi:hypothetical protein
MKAAVTVHKSMMRQDERESRRIEKATADPETVNEGVKKENVVEMNPTAKATIKFGIRTMLMMLKHLVHHSPAVFGEFITIANEILSELPPMALEEADKDIKEAIKTVFTFFHSILAGEIEAVPKSDRIGVLSPLLGIALAKGNLPLAFSVATRLLTLWIPRLSRT